MSGHTPGGLNDPRKLKEIEAFIGTEDRNHNWIPGQVEKVMAEAEEALEEVRSKSQLKLKHIPVEPNPVEVNHVRTQAKRLFSAISDGQVAPDRRRDSKGILKEFIKLRLPPAQTEASKESAAPEASVSDKSKEEDLHPNLQSLYKDGMAWFTKKASEGGIKPTLWLWGLNQRVMRGVPPPNHTLPEGDKVKAQKLEAWKEAAKISRSDAAKATLKLIRNEGWDPNSSATGVARAQELLKQKGVRSSAGGVRTRGGGSGGRSSSGGRGGGGRGGSGSYMIPKPSYYHR